MGGGTQLQWREGEGVRKGVGYSTPGLTGGVSGDDASAAGEEVDQLGNEPLGGGDELRHTQEESQSPSLSPSLPPSLTRDVRISHTVRPSMRSPPLLTELWEKKFAK